MIQLRNSLQSKEAIPKGNFVHSRTHNKKIQYRNINQLNVYIVLLNCFHYFLDSLLVSEAMRFST